MISDANKAFCDLAHAAFGVGWWRALPIMNVTRDEHRASVLQRKHDIDPTNAEIGELIRAAREKRAEIDELIETLINKAK